MRNLVKEYVSLGKTLEDLKKELFISINENEGMLCLNYNQIDSPKTNEIVRQCRGIVLDEDTLDIVHYPFYRFYNFEEVPEERKLFNWNNAEALEKIDGSLFGVFYHKDKWHISTRSQIGGQNILAIGVLTFGDMFDKAINMPREDFFNVLNKDIDYTFELCGPENQIVTPYKDTTLYLIEGRDKKNDFKEIDINNINIPFNNIKKPKRYHLFDDNGNFIGFEAMKKMAANVDNPTDEGYVVVDYKSYNYEFGYYPRTKVKNPSYVALHHLRGTFENNGLNYGGIVNIIFKGEQDEVLSTFPMFENKFKEVEEKYNKFMNELENEISRLKSFFDIPMEKRNDKNVKKEFALTINKKFSSFLFAMFKYNQSLREYMEKESTLKNSFFKTMYENYISKY